MNKAYNILDISKIIGAITKEVAVLNGKLLRGKNNINLYGKFLEDNLDYVKWLNKEMELRKAEVPSHVFKREISKKRMAKYPVAKITEENFLEIQNAIVKNLDFIIDTKE